MVGLLALDQILRLFGRCADGVALELHRRADLPANNARHTARFGVPADSISNLERLHDSSGLHQTCRLGSRLAPAVIDKMILAGDIGATKTALALFEVVAGSRLRLARLATFASRDYPSLEAILAGFLPAAGLPAVHRACFGVAGVVENGIAHLTNLPWVVEEQALVAILRTPSVSVINDLQATAFGMVFVDPTGFAVLHAGAERSARATVAVIAPGTGLGEALLIWDGERYHAIASEGGHCDFAPATDQEIELLRCLQQRFGHVSYERIVSGDGIATLYAFLRETGEPEPAWLVERLAHGDPNAVITEVALAGKDPVCVEAVDMFCAILGAEASNLALKGLATGGVIIGGGIAPKILPALQRGGLVARFTHKGRFSEWVHRLDLRVALDPQAPLVGAAYWANERRSHDA